eukprot:scaffold137391_cov127-Phaeocystis_antarctica.AAC.1
MSWMFYVRSSPCPAPNLLSSPPMHAARAAVARRPPFSRPAARLAPYRMPSPSDTRQGAWAFNQLPNFDTSKVRDTSFMFGELSINKVCAVNGVKMFVQGDCPSPEDLVTLVQGVDNLDQSVVLDQSVQVVVLVSGEMPFGVEGPLALPAGRNLTLVGNSSENGQAHVKVNVTEEFKVNGMLQLERLEVSRASLGDQNDSKVDVPLVDVLEGGTVEIIQTELRVKEGEVAVAVNKGSLVLREVIIAGELPASMAVTLILVASGDVGDVGNFTAADRAGLVQAIASLANVPPAAVALTLDAASAQLTFRICVSGSAEAVAAETRLKEHFPNASEASSKLG